MCAALLARMRIAPRADAQHQRFLRELRAGRREFTARTWLWSTVLLFGLANVFFIFMFLQVLGPAVAQERLGGAGAWAAILTAAGIGAIAGGVAALRQHPRRPLVASYDAFGSFVLSPLGAAIAGPLAVALGTSSALWLAAGALLVGNLTMLLIPAVWRIEARQPQGAWLGSTT